MSKGDLTLELSARPAAPRHESLTIAIRPAPAATPTMSDRSPPAASPAGLDASLFHGRMLPPAVSPKLSGVSQDFDLYMLKASDSCSAEDAIWSGRGIRLILEGGSSLEGTVAKLYSEDKDKDTDKAKRSINTTIASTGAETCTISWKMDIKFESPNWHENSALGCFATEEGGNTCVGLTLVRSSINAGGTFASTAGSNGMLLSFVWTEHAVPSIQMHGDVPCPLCRAIQRPSDTCETSAARCPVCLEDTACNKLACGHDMCAVCWARWTSASDGSQFIEEFLDMEEKAKFEYFNASFGELLEVDKFNDEERRLYAISFRDFICSQCGVAAEASGHYRLAAQFYAKCCDLLREETCSPFYISGRLYFHFAHGTRWNALGLALMRGASNADDLNRSLDVFDEAMGFLQDSGDTKTADALKTTCRNRAAVLREMNFWTGSALEHRYSYLKEEIEYCKLSGCDSAQLQAKAYSEHHLKVGDHPYYDIHQRAALMRGQKELTRLSNLYTSINPEGIPAAVKTDNAPEDTLICSDGDTGGGDATEDSARLMMTDEDGIEWIVSLDTTGDQGLTVTVEQNSGAPAKPEAAQRIMAKVQASMDGITEGNVMLGCIDEGLESDDQLCADDASGFTALKRQGDEAFRASKYEEAVEHYTEALALNEDHLVFCNRASAYINAKNFDAALSDAYRCTSLCPSFAKGWIRGAQAAGSCGKQGQAWSFARAGARLHPDNKELRDYHKIATKCCLVDPDNPRYMSDVNGHNWFTRNELQPFGDSLGSLVGGTEALIGELTDWMHEVDGISCAVDNTESLKQLELQFCEILFDAGRSKASLFDALRELGGEHTELVTNLSAAGKRLSDALQSFREESSSSDAADFLLSFGKGCEFFVGDLVLLSAVEGQTGVGEDQTADFTLMDQKTALIVGDKVQGMWPVQLQYAKPFVGNKWIVHVPEAAMSLLYSTVRSNLKRGLAHGVFQFERHVSGSVSLQMLPKDRTVANSVLAAAVNANQLKGVREALKRGASPDTLVGKPAVCALFVACQNGNGPIVKELIAHGANLEFEIMATEGQGVDTHVGRSNAHLSLEALLSCPQGATSLLIAAENALPLIVQILLTHGANPNAVGDDGCSPLFAAARAGNLRCVELLCEAGADVQGAKIFPAEGPRQSPLCIAAALGHASIVSYLAKRGADFQHGSPLPLIQALDAQHWKVAELCISLGADVNALQDGVVTPLCMSIISIPAATWLLEHGADPNARVVGGMTALFVVVKSQHLTAAAELLLEAGADPALKTAVGVWFDRAVDVYEWLVASTSGYAANKVAAQTSPEQLKSVLADNNPMNLILKKHKTFVSSLPFDLGHTVVISGLLGAPEHNGKAALVKGFKANRERVVVEVMGDAQTGGQEGAAAPAGDGGGKQRLSIKPKNLSAA